MKITKAELIELEICDAGLACFIIQAGDTDEPVEVASLVGGENTYSDLLWLAGKKLPKEHIVRFACDCALVNIEKIEPYTDKYDLIVEFLRNPTTDRDADVVDAAADVARIRGGGIRAAAAWAARAAIWAAAADAAADAAETAEAAAWAADDIARTGNEEQVNKLLKELFA